MVLSLWRIRTSDVRNEDLVRLYESNPNYFSFKIHHGGVFTTMKPLRYVNGKITYVDMIDIDVFSVHELNYMMNEIGYSGKEPMFYHFQTPELNLEYGLQALGADLDVNFLSLNIKKERFISVYVEHGNTNVNTYFKSPVKPQVRIEEVDDEPSSVRASQSQTGETLMLEWNHPVDHETQESCIDQTHIGQSSNVHEGDVHEGDVHEGDVHEGDCVQPSSNFDSSLFGGILDEEFDPFWCVNDVNDVEDTDYLGDEENLIVDVEVDMRDFNISIDHDAEFMGSHNVVDEEPTAEVEVDVVDNEEFESGSDGDVEGERWKRIRRLQKQSDSNLTTFYVSQTFGSAIEVKECIKKHAIESRRQLKLVKNDKTRIRAVCEGNIPQLKEVSSERQKCGQEYQGHVGGRGKKSKQSLSYQCPWVILVSKLPESETWMVKTFNGNHKCLQSRNIKHCNFKFLASEIVDQIESNPQVPVQAIKQQLERKFELGISKMKAYRAKSNAAVQLLGDFKEQYAQLRDYCLELHATNPGTTVKIEVEDGMEDTNQRVFKRIYVCLSGLKNGFKVLGRDLLGLDGAFMKGPYPGQILTAVGLDSNNGIFPVAYAIVEAETINSWKWFLECVGEDLGLGRRSNFTFISDRQKGIIQAISSVFPAAEHRFCLRHLHENMKLQWKGKAYKDLLWKCATASTVQHFTNCMDEVKSLNVEAYNWLAKIPPQHWSRSHFSGRANSDVLLNNMCEVFNKQLVDGRDKPIITALEYTREYLMKRIVNVLKVIEKSDGPLTPTATKMFELIKAEATKFNVLWSGGAKYQVSGPWGEQCVVDMDNRTCTCRRWELIGMPCKHSVATIWNMGINGQNVGLPETFVKPIYWLETWKKVYCFRVEPIKGRSMWPKSNIPTTLLPPKHHTPVGRPKKQRRKAADKGENMVEGGKLTRKLKTVSCGKCGNQGHNSRGCKGQGGEGESQTRSQKQSKKKASAYVGGARATVKRAGAGASADVSKASASVVGSGASVSEASASVAGASASASAMGGVAFAIGGAGRASVGACRKRKASAKKNPIPNQK